MSVNEAIAKLLDSIHNEQTRNAKILAEQSDIVKKLSSENQMLLERETQLIDQLDECNSKINALETTVSRTEAKMESLVKKHAQSMAKQLEYKKRLSNSNIKTEIADSVTVEALQTMIDSLAEENNRLFHKISQERRLGHQLISNLRKQVKEYQNSTASKDSLEQKTPKKQQQIDINSSPLLIPPSNENNLPKSNSASKTNARSPLKKEFFYHEVVRDKETRKRMHADDCDCCKDYYRLTKNIKPVNVPDTNVDRKQLVGRHRVWKRQPDTPPDFWNLDFPSTQDQIRRNEQVDKAL